MPRDARVSALLAGLRKVKRLGAGWVACCPAHADAEPSLKVDVGDDGRILLRCHAGCTVQAIAQAMGLSMKDLAPPADDASPFSPERAGHTRHLQVVGNTALKAESEPPRPPKWQWPEVARYDYTDADGVVLFSVVRRELDGRKTFTQEQPDGTRGLAGVTSRPLYRLPHVLEAVATGDAVVLVEGEKDVDTAETLGWTATTNCGGANSWQDAHADALRNANVIVVPDNDEPGRAWATKVCTSLLGVAAQVRVVVLPGLPDKGDLTDWVAAGGTAEALGGLILRAQPYRGGDPIPPSAGPSRFRLVSAAELEDLPPLRWLVEDVLPADALAAFVGPSGVGKTFVALDLACAVATGTRWLTHTIFPAAPVLYIAAEGTAGLRARVAAWAVHHGTRQADIPVWFICETVNLMDAEDPTHVLRAMTSLAVPPALVIVDTLHRAMPGGDENSAKDVGVVVAAADRIRRTAGCTVLLVHHTKKDADVERGSTALRAACDTLLLLKDEDGTLSLECEKQKDASAFAPRGLQLTATHGSMVVELAAGTDAGGRVADPANLTKKQWQTLKALDESSTRLGLTGTAWMDASGVSRAWFYKTVKALVAANLVMENQRGRYCMTANGEGALAMIRDRNSLFLQEETEKRQKRLAHVSREISGGEGGPPYGGTPPSSPPERKSGAKRDSRREETHANNLSRQSAGASSRGSALDGPPPHVLEGPTDDGPEPWWQR